MTSPDSTPASEPASPDTTRFLTVWGDMLQEAADRLAAQRAAIAAEEAAELAEKNAKLGELTRELLTRIGFDSGPLPEGYFQLPDGVRLQAKRRDSLDIWAAEGAFDEFDDDNVYASAQVYLPEKAINDWRFRADFAEKLADVRRRFSVKIGEKAARARAALNNALRPNPNTRWLQTAADLRALANKVELGHHLDINDLIVLTTAFDRLMWLPNPEDE